MSNSVEELTDPACDPQNPVQVEFGEVSSAAYKIKGGIEKTSCMKSRLSDMVETQIYFKKEFLQTTGSFKERGARYTLIMLKDEQKKLGVIAASAGNHALALAYHGHDLNIPVTVVMPIIAPIMKVESCRKYGAHIIVHGADIGESREYAINLGKEKSLMYVNGYDHPHILAGQGTVGLEVVDQVPDLDAIVVPIGGGGLIAGIAVAIKTLRPHVLVILAIATVMNGDFDSHDEVAGFGPNYTRHIKERTTNKYARIIQGVESERCPSFSTAREAGKPIYTKASSTLADGLAVPVVGVNAFATANRLIDKIVVVTEEYIALAILRLVEVEKSVVEGAGAAGFAAILQGLLPELKNKKVVIPLCGGNIDTTVLGRSLERGLAVDGRLLRFFVRVSDRPGGIAELTKLIASIGVSLKDIFHERAWLKSDIFSVQVKCVVETRDRQHEDELERLLRSHYTHVEFGTNVA